MRIDSLTLVDYRNVAEATVAFGPRFTVLYGHNGAGKTNLLEAIYLVSTLRSFRTTDLGALVRHDAAAGSVDLVAHDPSVDLPTRLSVRLVRHGSGVRRTAVADGKTVRTAADFYGRIRAVLFTPEDLGVLRGPPQGRRQFLDRMLFARERGHITDVTAYEKLVRSRNHVLRRDDLPTAERDRLLSTYEEGIAEVGARVWSRRTALLEALHEPFAAAFAGIHGRVGPSPASGPAARATVTYTSSLGEVAPSERAERLYAALTARRREDLRRGSTSVGPHRDEIVVTLDGRVAADFASQGQARALVLALKLAELEVTATDVSGPPVLLLDDVSSELDPGRTALMFEALAERAGQCLLTTTSPSHARLSPRADVAWWHVDRGAVTAGSAPRS